MFARIRENLAYKMLALIVAIFLRLYTSSLDNPTQTVQKTVPLNAKDVPAGLLLAGNITPITVSLTGTADDLSRMNEVNIDASVDVSHGQAGANPGLPVTVTMLPGSHSGVTISDFHPRVQTVMLAQVVRKRLPMVVLVQGSSKNGYSQRTPSVVPSEARVVGPADSVDAVARLVVRPDITGATDTVDDDFDIIPEDADGNEVPDVRVVPDTAHVSIGIIETGQTKEVFVSPNIVGALAPGYVIGQVTVKPETVLLTGSVPDLAGVGRVSTDPIDITGAKASLTAQAHCDAPPTVTLTSTDTVQVTVDIVRADTGSPAALFTH